MAKQSSSFGQWSKFDILSNRMFFNIFIHKPDKLVLDFIKKYFPGFAKKRRPDGWTVYPPGPIPKYDYTVHSLRFRKHPYYDAPYKEARLDILAQEDKNSRGITDCHLWFIFDSKKDINNGFKTLSRMFHEVSDHKKVSEHNDRKVAEYANTKNLFSPNDIEFVATEHELYKGKYKLFFRMGAFTYDPGHNFGYVDDYYWNPPRLKS